MKLRKFKDWMTVIDSQSPSTATNPMDWLAFYSNSTAIFLIGIFLLLTPYPHVTAIKEITYYLSAALFFFLVFYRRTDFCLMTPLTLPLAIFTSWAVATIPFALNQGNSLHDVYAHLLKYIMLYFILVNFFNTRKRFLLLTWIMMITATIFCAGGLIYFYVILGHKLSIRFFIYSGHFIPYLDYLYIFSILLSLNHLIINWHRDRRLLFFIPLVIVFAGTMLSQTRSAILAFLFSLSLYLHRRIKTFILVVILVLATVAVLLHANNRLADFKTFLHNERFDSAKIYLEMVKDRPFTGIGFGMQTYDDINLLTSYNKTLLLKDRPSHMFLSPHNLLIDITVRVGMVGLFLFLFLIFRFIRLAWQIIRHGRDSFIRDWGRCVTACFIAFFIQAMFSDAGFGIQAVVMYTIFAMMTILWRLNSETENERGADAV